MRGTSALARPATKSAADHRTSAGRWATSVKSGGATDARRRVARFGWRPTTSSAMCRGRGMSAGRNCGSSSASNPRRVSAPTPHHSHRRPQLRGRTLTRWSVCGGRRCLQMRIERSGAGCGDAASIRARSLTSISPAPCLSTDGSPRGRTAAGWRGTHAPRTGGAGDSFSARSVPTAIR